MSKKKPPKRTCAFPRCTRQTTGSHCKDHVHVAVLQAEINRLSATRDGRWEELLRSFPDLRRLGENLATLAWRADPRRAQNVEVVARSRGHGGHDGIAVLGNDIAIPGYAVAVKQDQGRLGAAVAKVRKCADELEGFLSPESSPNGKATRRCGARSCDGKNRRQPFDVRYCAFCGRSLTQSDERLQDSTRATQPPAQQDSRS